MRWWVIVVVSTLVFSMGCISFSTLASEPYGVSTLLGEAPESSLALAYVDLRGLGGNSELLSVFDLPEQLSLLTYVVKSVAVVSFNERMSPDVVVIEGVGLGMVSKYAPEILSVLVEHSNRTEFNVSFTERNYSSYRIYVGDEVSYFSVNGRLYVGFNSSDLEQVIDVMAGRSSNASTVFSDLSSRMHEGDISFLSRINQSYGVSATLYGNYSETIAVVDAVAPESAFMLETYINYFASQHEGVVVNDIKVENNYVISNLTMDIRYVPQILELMGGNETVTGVGGGGLK